jgi:hypothetical protein
VVYFGTVSKVGYILKLFRQCGVFWNFSDSVVYFGTVPTVWCILKLFRQCGIFRTVPTVWYILELFRQCGVLWNCSDSVVSDRLVYFGTVPTVGYIIKLLWQCDIFFSFHYCNKLILFSKVVVNFYFVVYIMTMFPWVVRHSFVKITFVDVINIED